MQNLIKKISAFIEKEETKKVLDFISKFIAWVLIVISGLMMVLTIISVTSVSEEDRQGDGHSILGFRLLIVKTDSMSLSDNNKDMDVHFKAGDLIFIKELKEEDKYKLKTDNIIYFISTNSENYGETVTHMIKSVVEKDGVVVGYKTYGTNSGSVDEAVVEPGFIIGKYVGQLDNVGNFFAFFKTTSGYITCILVPFLLLIAYNGTNVILLFRKYKKEQYEELQKEKDYIQKEKDENQRLLEELKKLKEELGKGNE
jgi:hypothetical protein